MITDVLRRYAAKHATVHEVLRALASHDGYFAPVGYATRALDTAMFDKLSVWGAESKLPPGKLWLFTDEAAGHAALAKGLSPGPCAGPLRGDRLLAYLPAGLAEFQVNPGSPAEDGWYMGADALQLAAAWGRAIGLERALDAKGGDDWLDRLLDFDGWISFALPSSAIATAVGAAGLKNPAMVFTAPDCALAARAAIGEQAATLTDVVTTGLKLFGAFETLGIDGYLVNPMGPGTRKVFNTTVARGLVQGIAGRDELRRLEAEARRLAGAT